MSRSEWLKVVGFLALLAGAWLVLKAYGIDFSTLHAERVRGFILSFGVWAPLMYLLMYGQPFVPLPSSLMMGLAGVAFGKAWGIAAAVVGGMLRACAAFLIARWLGRETVAKLLHGNLATLNQKLGANSFKAVLLIRLLPNVPFDLQNYGLGFSGVRFGPYVLATFLGILPASFAFVYLGESLLDPTQWWKIGLAAFLIIGLIVGTSLLKGGGNAEDPVGGR